VLFYCLPVTGYSAAVKHVNKLNEFNWIELLGCQPLGPQISFYSDDSETTEFLDIWQGSSNRVAGHSLIQASFNSLKVWDNDWFITPK
jgi:hypothetical protein